MTLQNFDLNDDTPFFVGCNYWASHAGIAMWSDWRPDVVAEDFAQMGRAGLEVARVFPLWPEFQPLKVLRTGGGAPVEYGHGDRPLADDPVSQAGVSSVMLDRFEAMADSAQQGSVKLVVGLITGWMSGRLFVPPAFEGVNVITDSAAIVWQVRFVRAFVARFKDHPAIAAWDLGNECNCMGGANRDQAWVWTNAIVQAIRSVDRSRPIVSGMHSLAFRPDRPWHVEDQGELTDILTTHPYPMFTPNCDLDPLNTLRSGLHATAESRLYEDLGGKPCFIEEIGTLGPQYASETIAADYIRTVLFSAWANGCHGLVWWCAYDQTHLDYPPYEWIPLEQELGLFRIDREPKPVVLEIGRFAEAIRAFGLSVLPPRLTDAVCLVSHDQEHWTVAYGAFVLAKQAGRDIKFHSVDRPLPDANVYMLPSVAGARALPRRRWLEILARVSEGATLYISYDDASITFFKEVVGLDIQTRQHSETGATSIKLSDWTTIPVRGKTRANFEVCQAEVLGTEPDGNPIFTVSPYGKGKVYFVGLPLEKSVATTPGAYQQTDAYRIYERIFEDAPTERVCRKADASQVGVTEHIESDWQRIVVAVNYSPEVQDVELAISGDWQVAEPLRGHGASRPGGGHVRVQANDASVLRLVKVTPER